ncbi:bacteriochlorophyll 4-vinyl reductase [Acidiphilium sp.]|uniref:bacteriochlorophyll 4-vinyl reductase n=1 Tax=Acidiphilium sp. TaxID=527 RepID=UPI003D02C115
MATPHVFGQIGPNAVWRLAEALDAADLAAAKRRIFADAGLAHYLTAMPQAMVPETEVIALHNAMRATLGIAPARRIGFDAGVRTGDYLLARRIPPLAQAALRALPRRWASAALLRAIGKNGWTFCGTGQFSARAGTPVRIELRNCPICRDTAADQPVCDYYAGAFERLFRALIDPAAEVREISCHATGAEACVFEIGASRPMQALTRHPAPDPAGPAPIRG